jgi:hypothetical protein
LFLHCVRNVKLLACIYVSKKGILYMIMSVSCHDHKCFGWGVECNYVQPHRTIAVPNFCDFSKSPILFYINFIIYLFPWSLLFWPSLFHLQFYTFFSKMCTGNFWTLFFYLIIIGEEMVKAWVTPEQMGRYLGRLAPKGSTVHFVRYINMFSNSPILL